MDGSTRTLKKARKTPAVRRGGMWRRQTTDRKCRHEWQKGGEYRPYRACDNERETAFSKGGKVVYTAPAKRSADGRTLTVTGKGINAVGQNVDGAAVYDKQ